MLLEAIKLISHEDTSSGMVTDVINNCIDVVDRLCRSAEEDNQKYFFDSILKIVKNKAFKEWSEYAYELLRSTVYFVYTAMQADKVYAIFPILELMYADKQYPAMHLITYGIMQKLGDEAAATQYLMDHIEVNELRVIAVEKALQEKRYGIAEQLCIDALNKGDHWSTTQLRSPPVFDRTFREASG